MERNYFVNSVLYLIVAEKHTLLAFLANDKWVCHRKSMNNGNNKSGSKEYGTHD